jgi:hypothetical protein
MNYANEYDTTNTNRTLKQKSVVECPKNNKYINYIIKLRR